jgi:autotransporter family porin
MANTRSLNSSAKLRRFLFRTSLLSSGLMLAAMPKAEAGCVDSASATQCSDGTSNVDLNYISQNPMYLVGDFVLGLDNFQLEGAGISLSGVGGNSGVTLANGSSVSAVGVGISVSSFGGAAIYADGDVSGSEGIVADTGFSGTPIQISTTGGHVIKGDVGNGISGRGYDVTVNSHSQVIGEANGIIVYDIGSTTINTFNSVTGNSFSGISATSLSSDPLSTLFVHAIGDVSGNHYGINAYTIFGDITVVADRNVLSKVVDGIAAYTSSGTLKVITGINSHIVSEQYVGISAYTWSGDSSVVANGSVSGTLAGISTYSIGGGDIDVETGSASDILSLGLDGFGDGIQATVSDYFAVDTIGTISIKANGKVAGAYNGISAIGTYGAVNITANDQITGHLRDGIAAVVNRADVSIITGASSQIKSESGAGIYAASTLRDIQEGEIDPTSDVTVINDGTVEGVTAGISTFTYLGDTQIKSGGYVKATSGAGIVAKTGVGNIEVLTTPGSLVEGFGGAGIDIFSVAGLVEVNTAASSTVRGSGGDGIRAYTVAGKGAKVHAEGSVEGVLYGIEAYADGPTSVVANADVVGHSAAGIYAVGLSSGTSVSTAAGHSVRGEYLDGITAISIYSGDTVVDAQGDVFGSLNGISAFANNGSTTVTTGKGNITATNYSGINASAQTDLTITTSSKITSGGAAGVSAFTNTGTLGLFADIDSSIVSTHGSGILAGSYFAADIGLIVDGMVSGGLHGIETLAQTGDLSVKTGSSATIKGLGGDGISLKNAGEGLAQVELSGETSGSDHGVKAVSEKSAVEILNSGLIIGFATDGIYADGFTTAQITNSGMVMGLTDGVKILSKQGNTLVNSGTISNSSLAESDLAIVADFSATTITNSAGGTINGRVLMSSSTFDDTLNNAGLWQTSGLSYFGDGDDEVSNSGVIKFGSHAGTSEMTSFSNLENLVNTGTLSGLDQSQGDGSVNFDKLNVSGNYVGGTGAIFALDAFVGGGGSLSDVVTIQGNSSGRTALHVRNTNPTPALPGGNGILLVDVQGTATASDFFLAGGPVNAGLFNYDLAFQSDAGGNQFLLKSAPNAASAETVVAVASVQSIWQGGVDAWTTHQGELRDDVAAATQITAVAYPSIPETRGNKALWASIRGDWTQQKSQTSFTYLNAANTYSAGYNQNTYGVDGGVDFVTELGGDARAMFGIVAGYQTSNLDFKASANGIELEGGSLGAYGSLSAHGLFADVLVKNDWLSLDYKVAGTGNAKTHGQSLGASGDVGYRFGGARGFIEPMVSLATSSTTIDDFVLGGTTVSPDVTTSTRLGAGARFGLSDANYAMSLTARVWNGLGGGNDVNVSGTGLSVAVSDAGFGDGVSGELSGKLSMNLSEAALLFASGSLQFAKDTTSQSLNGGVRFNW